MSPFSASRIHSGCSADTDSTTAITSPLYYTGSALLTHKSGNEASNAVGRVSTSISILWLCIVLLLSSCTAGQARQDQQQDASPPATSTPATSTPEQVEEPTATPQSQIGNNSSSATSDETEEAITFRIQPEGTEARFIIQEILLGSDKTVIGATSQVTGELSVVPSNPSASQIGTITINARDLKTDSSRRNRSIQRQVLLTAKDEYEFITFEPTSIEGLPDTINVGDTFTFSVVGDLTILDTSRSESFDMSVTVVSPQELTGMASTMVLYADYGISIPKVPIVASVEDEVQLEFEFTAQADE